jgi:hypothetical protein
MLPFRNETDDSGLFSIFRRLSGIKSGKNPYPRDLPSKQYCVPLKIEAELT